VKAFVKGFFINAKNHKLFYSTFSTIGDKIRMYDLDKLLSVYAFSNQEYKKYIFDKVNIVYNNTAIDKNTTDQKLQVYKWFEELFVKDTDESLKALYDKFDNTLLNNDAQLIAKKQTFLSKKIFCSSILVFWTSVKGIIVDNDYNIKLDDTRGADIHSHTCSNLLVLPVGGHIKSKQALYNALLSICVWNIKDAFDMV
jgi:hypothetical protein